MLKKCSRDFGVLFWRGISLASKICSHEHLIVSLDALCPGPLHPGLKLLHNLAMLIPSEALTQLSDKVLPFHSEIVKAVNILAASQNKCTLEEAKDEGGEDDQEEDRPKKKARIT